MEVASRASGVSATSLAYGLFLAVNAASVWGGSFPFLPMEFQTREILSRFALTETLAFALGLLACAAVGYLRPRPAARSFPVKRSVACYLAGWVALIAATYVDDADLALALVGAGGALLGLGAACFYVLWQQVFASREAATGTRELVAGTALAAVMYVALYLIPRAVTAFLIPLVFLPLFALVIELRGREVEPDDPMFADEPRAHRQVYRAMAGVVTRGAFCVGTLAFCAGVMRSLAVAEPSIASLVNVLSMGAQLVAGVGLLLVWRARDVRLSITRLYRLCFPVLITALFVLPLLGDGYERWLAAGLSALFAVAVILVMMQCAQISRDAGVRPSCAYGLYAGIVYALHGVGFLATGVLGGAGIASERGTLLVALVTLYVLGLMHFVVQGGFRRAYHDSDPLEAIELVAPRAPRAERRAAAVPAQATAPAARAGDRRGDDRRGDAGNAGEPQFRDRVSKQVEALRRHYGLSSREAEVLELIVRGNSVPRIAERLVISENTVQTHAKRLYRKLDVHKRQELLDLVDQFDPRGLVTG